MAQLSHLYIASGKTIALSIWTFFWQSDVSLPLSLSLFFIFLLKLFNMLSRFIKTFLPRSKYLLISWQQSWSAVILDLPPIKIDLLPFPIFPLLCVMKWWAQMPWYIYIYFLMLSFKSAFSHSYFTFIKRLKAEVTTWSNNPIPGHIPDKIKIQKTTSTPMFTVALFIQ